MELREGGLEKGKQASYHGYMRLGVGNWDAQVFLGQLEATRGYRFGLSPCFLSISRICSRTTATDFRRRM